MRFLWLGLVCSVLLTCVGCPSTTTGERNPFLSYVESFGASTGSTQTPSTGGAASGAGAEQIFRLPMTLTFVNAYPNTVLETSFVAWVYVSSVRSAEQQDALLRQGYVQLNRELRIGTAYTLPLGTFVYNGSGTAGAGTVRLVTAAAQTGQGTTGDGTGQGDSTVQTSASKTFELATPDQVLVFSQPPVSCDSVAFTFYDPATALVFEGPSTGYLDTANGVWVGGGGYKTLAQVDVYECDPFRPGLFFDPVGGARNANQYQEGDPITFTFRSTADLVTRAFAVVTIGAPAQTP